MQQVTCRATVVIALYNSAATLERAVRSALRQTLEDIEIIIVDDCSGDRSLSVARELAASHSGIQVIALPQNKGKANAVNVAVDHASGEWIAVLDADDWYEPQRLRVMTEAGDEHGADLVADNQCFWDAGANAMVQTAFVAGQTCAPLTRDTFIAGSNPYADFDYGMLKPLIRTDFIRRHRLRYRENARLSEDFLYLVDFFSLGGNAVLLSHPMYNWTQPFGSVSRRWTLTGAGQWRYNYQSALAAYADAKRDLAKARDGALIVLLARRMRAFRRLGRLSKVNQVRASGAGWPRVAVEVARYPSIWPLLATRFIRLVSNTHGEASLPYDIQHGSIDNTAT